MTELITYFDNASTSYPKPDEVYSACDKYLRVAGNPGRGAHRLAYQAARTFFESRELIANHLGIVDTSRLIFTSGCTQSIALVISGMLGSGALKSGDSVLVTSFEHNAVMRTLAYHERVDHIKVVTVPPGADGTMVDLVALRRILSGHPTPALAAFTRASNVTGVVLDLPAIAPLLKQYNVPLLLDAAQSAGLIHDDLGADDAVSFYVTSGHKGFYGPPGVGLLYVRDGFELDPPFCGGTGSRSESLKMPEFLPDRLEPGTHAMHLAAGLAAGVKYVVDRGIDEIYSYESSLMRRFFEATAELDFIEIKGRDPFDPGHLPLASFTYKGHTADRVADWLDTGYGIAVRAGLHCAVTAHKVLNSEKTGLARVSFGAFNTMEQVDQLVVALKELAKIPA